MGIQSPRTDGCARCEYLRWLCPETIPIMHGVFVDIKDLQGLAEGSVWIQQNPESASRTATAAHGVIGTYDWERSAEQYNQKTYRQWVRQ